MIEPIRRLAFRLQPPRQIFKRIRRHREVLTHEAQFEMILQAELQRHNK